MVELHAKVVGFVVAQVSEVLRVPTDTIEETPAFSTMVSADYIVGVVKLPDKLMVLLDLDRLLAGSVS